MGNPPDKKIAPDEGARRLASLFGGARKDVPPKPVPEDGTAGQPGAREPMRPSQPPPKEEGAARLRALFGGPARRVESAPVSESAVDDLDEGWGDDEAAAGGEEASTEAEAADDIGEHESKPRRGVASADRRKTAVEKAAARKRKSQERRERQRSRAAAARQKQKQKQRKRRASEALAEGGDVDEHDRSAPSADASAPIAISRRTDLRDWRRMGLLVAGVIVIGAVALLLLAKAR